MTASHTTSGYQRDEMTADQNPIGTSVNKRKGNRVAPSYHIDPRRSYAGTAARHSINADARTNANCLQTLRRTSPTEQSDQWRIRQLHRNTVRKRSSSPQRAGRGRVDSTSTTATPIRRERGSSKATHWGPAIKEVLMGIRSTDAIVDADRLKGRKLTYWHGVKIKKASKARISNFDDDVLHKKCCACIEIVEQQAREAAEREQAAADPDGILLATESKVASTGNIRLVFSLFHSVPEVVGLDSIYKMQLFHELRIERYAAGSVVFHQRQQQAMICVILAGRVQLKSKHSGVTFQAGNLSIGEVLGSTTQKQALLTATCSAVTTLLCLDSDRFAAVINDSASEERIAKKEFLKCSPVFSTLSDDALNTLEALFTTATLDNNQVLCKEGSRVDHVYVVKRGFLRLLKAFIPDDDECRRSRPSSRAMEGKMSTAIHRKSLGAGPSQSCDQNASEETPRAAPGERRTRLKHFDLGEIGPKDLLGENGVLQQVDRSPPIQASSAAAPRLPAICITHEEHDQESPPQEGDVDDDGDGSDRENGGDRDASLTTDAAEGAIPSSATGFRPRKPAFIVSATASGGGAEVYVANAYALKRLQTDDFLLCWKTAERLHQARAQAWSAGALAQQLRRQMEWEAYKREILSHV